MSAKIFRVTVRLLNVQCLPKNQYFGDFRRETVCHFLILKKMIILPVFWFENRGKIMIFQPY